VYDEAAEDRVMRLVSGLLGLLVACSLVACHSTPGTSPGDGGDGRGGNGQPGAGGQSGNAGQPGTGGQPGAGGQPGSGGQPGGEPPAPSCNAAPAGGSARPAAPTLLFALADRFHEGWLGSPSVVDLDGDGKREIVLTRDQRVLVFGSDGKLRWSASVGGRIWSSAVTGDFAGDARREVVVASRANVVMYDAAGAVMPGFPATWRDELRSLAAGDIDGDGKLEIAVATTSLLRTGDRADVMQILRGDGTVQRGFPPNTSGTSGCGAACYLAGAFDQNLALGPLDGDAAWDIVVPHDNAYISWHRGGGVAFDSASIFRGRPKVPGIRFLHQYAEAQAGFSATEETSNQAHFTNSPPTIADVDGDGKNEIVVLGSVQNASQDDRLRGVALWLVNPDGTRPAKWLEPLHIPRYLAGLVDFEDDNIVGATNQVALGDIDPTAPGLEMVFAGYDGRIHAVSADRRELWSQGYTTASNVLTAGVTIADLSGDGAPEIVFATYSTQAGAGALVVLGAGGAPLHQLPLPGRGSMAVPTIADVDGNGTLEIVLNLKDGEDKVRSGLVYTVAGSSGNCLLWPTGRGNELRNGYFPRR
jgi:hypothetical protein